MVLLTILGGFALAEENNSPIEVNNKQALKVKKTPFQSIKVKEDSPWYAGAGLVGGQAKSSDCEDITYGFMVKVGYDFSEYLGAEVRGLRTNWEYEGGKLKHLGAFVKPMYGVNEEITLYGLAGYAKTVMGTKRNFSDTGFAYGFGVDYALDEDFALFVDYERLLHNAPYDFNALSLGLSYNF